MLVALNERGEPIIASRSRRDELARCPECEEPLVYKNGQVIVTHWAHRPNGDCNYGEGESRQHMAMKSYIYDVLRSWSYRVEMEVPIGYRRADVVVYDDDGDPHVIECQASPISVDEVQARMEDYWGFGIPVLWVWWHERIKRKWADEYRLPKEVIYVAEAGGDNTIYVGTDAGPIQAWIYEDAPPRSNDFGDYTPKTLKVVTSRWRAIHHDSGLPKFTAHPAVNGGLFWCADVEPDSDGAESDRIAA